MHFPQLGTKKLQGFKFLLGFLPSPAQLDSQATGHPGASNTTAASVLKLSPDPGNRTRLTVSNYWSNNRWGSHLIDVLECRALWSLLTLLLYIQAHESDVANENLIDHLRPSLCSTGCYHCVTRGHEIKGSHGKLLHPSAERSLPRMLECRWLCLLYWFCSISMRMTIFFSETQNP